MSTVSVAGAKAHSSELTDHVETGNAIGATRKPVDKDRLRALTEAMPRQDESAGDLVRSMRDGDRY